MYYITETKRNRRYPSDEIAILIEKYLKPKYDDELNIKIMQGDKIIKEYNKKD